MVHCEVEIAAPPQEVRKVVLDFPKYGEWQKLMQRIETIPSSKPATALVAGDKINADIGRAKNMSMTITRNDEDEFRWKGGAMMGAFTGEHYFIFKESLITPGGTTFLHGEDHGGWLSFLFREGWPMHTMVSRMFLEYSEDLKKRVESLRADGKLGERAAEAGIVKTS